MNKWLLCIEKRKTLFYNGKQNTQNRRFFFFQKQVIVILKHEVNMIMTLTKVHHPSILIKLTFVKKHLLDMDNKTL